MKYQQLVAEYQAKPLAELMQEETLSLKEMRRACFIRWLVAKGCVGEWADDANPAEFAGLKGLTKISTAPAQPDEYAWSSDEATKLAAGIIEFVKRFSGVTYRIRRATASDDPLFTLAILETQRGDHVRTSDNTPCIGTGMDEIAALGHLLWILQQAQARARQQGM